MSSSSSIEWTNATWNPVTGCDRVSPGCAHCYALELAPRLRRFAQAREHAALAAGESYTPGKWLNVRDGGKRSGPAFGVTLHPGELEAPLRWRKPRLIDSNLTGYSDMGMARDGWPTDPDDDHHGVPEHLRGDPYAPCWEDGADLPELDLAGIDWLIVGGESGPGHRPMDPQWARDLRDICLAARWPCCCAIGAPPDRHAPECDSHGGGTAFFFKQHGGRTPKAGGRELDGRTWDELPRAAALGLAS